MELSGMPLWAWILFYVLVLIMLVADLKMFGKKGQHEVNVGEALRMTGVWIGVSLLFCVGIYFFYPHDPHEKALEFLSGYLIEKSLSMDNLFVFLMLFSFFGVDRKYQHEVLFWGIFGALILRSIFIFAGAAIVERFDWVLGLFGLFLLYTGAKMFAGNNDQQSNPSNNVIVKWFKKLYPVTEGMRNDKFFVIENGKRFATPLFITLIVIETTDVAFAVDSIPAVFSVSRDPFIVLTSNIFAILGLRALYFALAAVSQYFKYLKYGLGVILIFIGIKMLLEMDGYINAIFQHFGCEIAVPHIEIPTPVSLIVIFSVLGLSMALSAIIKTKEK
ncbi:MAG: TerC family protein [Bacteroidales bacterium]|nr:TerC family protein [Bacteroidales bacterium]